MGMPLVTEQTLAVYHGERPEPEWSPELLALQRQTDQITPPSSHSSNIKIGRKRRGTRKVRKATRAGEKVTGKRERR